MFVACIGNGRWVYSPCQSESISEREKGREEEEEEEDMVE